VSEVEDDQIGSKLWLLRRRALTEDVEVDLQGYVYEALEWMIEDGIAERIEVETYSYGLPENKRLNFIARIYKADGNVVAFKFEDVWNNTSVINVGG